LKIAALLAGPVGWMGVVYLGSLAVLLVAAFWSLDELSGKVVQGFSLGNFETLINEPVYRKIIARTVAIAALVTITDMLLALPIAFFMARVANKATRGALVVAVLMPLWASYLVKVYAWRTMFATDGVLNWLLGPLGVTVPTNGFIRVWIVMAYLWLPYMILPVYAGFERVQDSLLDAAADLGARPLTVLRTVVMPLTVPALAAGSIFTFSLTLGDYITPQLVSNTQFIGNVVYANVGIANNLPLAAALATVPIAVMMVYLLGARRAGAFEAL
jgi:putative spermidine/putrescine transport system permease protein